MDREMSDHVEQNTVEWGVANHVGQQTSQNTIRRLVTLQIKRR